jgi:hypothetical protein
LSAACLSDFINDSVLKTPASDKHEYVGSFK